MWQLRIALALGISSVLAIKSDRALTQSQIVPDGTLGAESSIVIPNFDGLPVEAIGGGATRGANLFHSFQEFNVSAGRGAYFYSQNATIQNILARVTGSNPSQILGTLGTFGNSNPNLFLINPNGIIFGPNARLDVGGSFVASTASAVTFPNGIGFSATNPQTPPLLTINVPVGLQYGGNPGSVSVQGANLEVPDGQTLALVGGDISLDGSFLAAPSGRVELGAVAGTGTVGLNGDSSKLSLSFPQGVALGNISLTNDATAIVTAGGGGSIAVNTFDLNMAGGSNLFAGIASGLDSSSAIAGNIEINATGAIDLTDGSSISNVVLEGARGQGGNINITTGQLRVSDGSLVGASSFGEGGGGNLTVNASDSVQLIGTSADGLSSSLSTSAGSGSSGKGGDVTINTGSLLVQDGAAVYASTFAGGDGGNLTVNASNSVQLLGTSANGRGSNLSARTIRGSSGKGGDVTINTGSLLVRDGAEVSAFTSGTGKGGNLTIDAPNLVQLLDTSANGEGSRLLTQANQGSSGKAGDVTINTDTLLVRDGAEVSANSFGAGNGGNLTIDAPNLVQLVGTSADGQSPSRLTSEAYGTGAAGNLSITTGQFIATDGAYASTSTYGAGRGGELTVNASEFVELIGSGRFSSGLYTETGIRSTGDSGNLTVNTPVLLVRDGARVSASSFGAGKAGDLAVNASQGIQLIGESADGRFSSRLIGEAFGTGEGINQKFCGSEAFER
jgi:filamentous hemagglutinin family protein